MNETDHGEVSMTTSTETTIETHPTLPTIRMTRDFAATPGQGISADQQP